jgi:hypothetical protein
METLVYVLIIDILLLIPNAVLAVRSYRKQEYKSAMLSAAVCGWVGFALLTCILNILILKY